MVQWGMVIDLDRCCTGCQTCVVACRQENNVPFAGPEEARKNRAIHWLAIRKVEHEGSDEHDPGRYVPVPCQHCTHPLCVKVCPVGATYKNEEGITGQIPTRCIGCRYCATACPYTVRFFNWYAPSWPEEMKPGLTREVAVRQKGVVEKCTFCHHRLQKAKTKARAEGRALRDGDYTTACAESCPAKAIVVGDFDDPDSRVAKLAKSPRAWRLMADLGTHPNVVYLSQRGLDDNGD